MDSDYTDRLHRRLSLACNFISLKYAVDAKMKNTFSECFSTAWQRSWNSMSLLSTFSDEHRCTLSCVYETHHTTGSRSCRTLSSGTRHRSCASRASGPRGRASLRKSGSTADTRSETRDHEMSDTWSLNIRHVIVCISDFIYIRIADGSSFVPVSQNIPITCACAFLISMWT